MLVYQRVEGIFKRFIFDYRRLLGWWLILIAFFSEQIPQILEVSTVHRTQFALAIWGLSRTEMESAIAEITKEGGSIDEISLGHVAKHGVFSTWNIPSISQLYVEYSQLYVAICSYM
jgi:hypothetical protein